MADRTELREDARQNRARVIEAGRDLFREQGISADMHELARRAGVAVGTIYRHYPSKDDLVLAILDDARTSFLDALDAIKAASPLASLEGLLASTMDLSRHYGWLIEAYLGRQLSVRCRDEMERQSLEIDIPGRCRVLVQQAIDSGEVRSDINVDTVAAMLAGVTTPWVCQPLLEERTAAEIGAEVIRILTGGLRPADASA